MIHTTKLIEEIQALQLQENQVAIAWLGQSGDIIKASPDKYVMIDPYLTDYCEEKLGLLFKRLMPVVLEPVEAAQLPLTAYLMTHHHEDHFDPHAISRMGQAHATYPFYTTPTTIQSLLTMGISQDRCKALTAESHDEIAGVEVYGTFADHGELAPDAVGIILKINGKVIYHMGDTCYHPDKFAEIAASQPIDLLIPPINGMYGNLTTEEAILVTGLIQPQIVTPAHFWMLPGNNGGDVVRFVEGVREEVSETEICLFQQGEIFVF